MTPRRGRSGDRRQFEAIQLALPAMNERGYVVALAKYQYGGDPGTASAGVLNTHVERFRADELDVTSMSARTAVQGFLEAGILKTTPGKSERRLAVLAHHRLRGTTQR